MSKYLVFPKSNIRSHEILGNENEDSSKHFFGLTKSFLDRQRAQAGAILRCMDTAQ